MDELVAYLRRVPAVRMIGHSKPNEEWWWVKFRIDIRDALAWHVVQELGYVLNYISIEERLPTVFMPVSPPPYLNGGPKQFLSWVIEAKDPSMLPATVAQWLEGRLPTPVDSRAAWELDGDDEGLPDDDIDG